MLGFSGISRIPDMTDISNMTELTQMGQVSQTGQPCDRRSSTLIWSSSLKTRRPSRPANISVRDRQRSGSNRPMKVSTLILRPSQRCRLPGQRHTLRFGFIQDVNRKLVDPQLTRFEYPVPSIDDKEVMGIAYMDHDGDDSFV